MNPILSRLLEEKIVAIVRGIEADSVIKLAEALASSGIHLIEITCNTPGVASMIETVSAALGDEAVIGAGTVTSTQLAGTVIDAGARYVLAPNLDKAVLDYCQERAVPMIPGATTCTEILQALEYGVEVVKLFPAAALGTSYLKQIRGPLDDAKIMAVGGVNKGNAAELLAAGADALGIGGSLVSRELVAKGAWDDIRARAAELVQIVKAAQRNE